MSAFSAAAADDDGDTIKALRARVASLEALLRGEPGFYIAMPRSVLEQALTTLEGWNNYDKWVWPESALSTAKQNTAEMVPALRAALEQPPVVEQPQAEQETKSYKVTGKTGEFCVFHSTEVKRGDMVYTHPQPPRQPLTDEWLNCLWRQTLGEPHAPRKSAFDFARAIERAHGIGGEA